MARKIPGTIKELNLFVEGIGFLGVVEDMKYPHVRTKKERVNGVVIDTGILEELVFEGNLTIASAEIYKHANGKSIITKGKTAYVEGGVNKKMNSTFGGFLDAELDSLKVAEKMKTKIKMDLNVYNLNLNGEEVYDIDLLNDIAKIGGKDIYEATRSAVM